MKRILLLIVAAGFIASCSEDKFKEYDSPNCVYFDQVTQTGNKTIHTPIDSVMFSFAEYNPVLVDTLYGIPVSLMGDVAGFDREIKVSVLPKSTATPGVHYQVLEKQYMKAGAHTGYIYVKLLRNAELKDSILKLNLRIEPSADFANEYEFFKTQRTDTTFHNALECELQITDKYVKPIGWTSMVESYLKDFSITKVDLICTLFGVERSVFNNEKAPDRTTLTAWQTYLYFYLENYKREHGTPLMDENNKEVVVGAI